MLRLKRVGRLALPQCKPSFPLSHFDGRKFLVNRYCIVLGLWLVLSSFCECHAQVEPQNWAFTKDPFASPFLVGPDDGFVPAFTTNRSEFESEQGAFAITSPSPLQSVHTELPVCPERGVDSRGSWRGTLRNGRSYVIFYVNLCPTFVNADIVDLFDLFEKVILGHNKERVRSIHLSWDAKERYTKLTPDKGDWVARDVYTINNANCWIALRLVKEGGYGAYVWGMEMIEDKPKALGEAQAEFWQFANSFHRTQQEADLATPPPSKQRPQR
jgi:hypothetical protein